MPGNKKNPIVRILSAFVAASFLLTQHSLPVSAQVFSSIKEVSGAAFPEDLSKIKIPPNIGKLEEASIAGERLVILVQDAHAIPDAQKNIRNLIDFFQETYGLDTVALEGTTARLNAQIFKSFPDKQLLKEVFSAYLKEGELTGTTMAAVFNEKDAAYEGIEDWGLYEEGYAYYLESQNRREKIEPLLERQKEALKLRKEKSYSPGLLKVDAALQEFHRGNSDLLGLLQVLAAAKAPEEGGEIALLLKENSRRPETRIPIEIEVKSIANQVKEYFNTRPAAGEREAVTEFNKKFQAFQISQLTAEQFAAYLKDLCRGMNLPFKFSGDLDARVKEQKKIQDIEGTRFFSQLEDYARTVKESLMKSETERALDQDSRRLYLLERLSKMELTREQWHQVKSYAYRGEFLGPNNIRLSREHSERLIPEPDLRQLFMPHLLFYANAELRDEGFVKNISALFQKKEKSGEGRQAILLVAGGFHTEGLIARLKEAKISYLLLMPEIKALPGQINYVRHMRGLVSWKDYFEIKDGKINVYNAFVRYTRDKLLETAANMDAVRGVLKSGSLLKEWRDQIIRDLAERGRIAESARYTRFIDEAAGPDGTEMMEKNLLVKVDRFVAGLKDLQARGQLSEQNIARLLRPAAVTSWSTYVALAPNQEIIADFTTVVDTANLSENFPASGELSQKAPAARLELRSEQDDLLNEFAESFYEDAARRSRAEAPEEGARGRNMELIRGVAAEYWRQMDNSNWDNENKIVMLGRFMDLINTTLNGPEALFSYLNEINTVLQGIESRFGTEGAEAARKTKKEFLAAVRSFFTTVVSYENSEGSRSYRQNPFKGIEDFRDFFQEVFSSWDGSAEIGTARYRDNGLVLFRMALQLADIGKSADISSLEKAGWKSLVDFAGLSQIEFNGTVYGRGEAAVSTSEVAAEFSEGKNPIFRVGLLDEQGVVQKKILVKMGVRLPAFDEIVTEAAEEAGLPSYRTERFSTDADSPALQLIEFIPSQIIYAKTADSETPYSNLGKLNSLERAAKLKALEDLGGNLALEHLLGGKDSFMKHFLLSDEGRFFKIDHEYLFKYEETVSLSLPATLEKTSDFWNFLEEVKKGQPSGGFGEEAAIRGGFDAVLNKALYNQEGFRDRLLKIIQSKNLPSGPYGYDTAKIAKHIEERARSSYEMLRGLAERSELRSAPGTETVWARTIRDEERKLTGEETRALEDALAQTGIQAAGLDLNGLIFDEKMKLEDWMKQSSLEVSRSEVLARLQNEYRIRAVMRIFRERMRAEPIQNMDRQENELYELLSRLRVDLDLGEEKIINGPAEMSRLALRDGRPLPLDVLEPLKEKIDAARGVIELEAFQGSNMTINEIVFGNYMVDASQIVLQADFFIDKEGRPKIDLIASDRQYRPYQRHEKGGDVRKIRMVLYVRNKQVYLLVGDLRGNEDTRDPLSFYRSFAKVGQFVSDELNQDVILDQETVILKGRPSGFGLQQIRPAQSLIKRLWIETIQPEFKELVPDLRVGGIDHSIFNYYQGKFSPKAAEKEVPDVRSRFSAGLQSLLTRDSAYHLLTAIGKVAEASGETEDAILAKVEEDLTQPERADILSKAGKEDWIALVVLASAGNYGISPVTLTQTKAQIEGNPNQNFLSQGIKLTYLSRQMSMTSDKNRKREILDLIIEATALLPFFAQNGRHHADYTSKLFSTLNNIMTGNQSANPDHFAPEFENPEDAALAAKIAALEIRHGVSRTAYRRFLRMALNSPQESLRRFIEVSSEQQGLADRLLSVTVSGNAEGESDGRQLTILQRASETVSEDAAMEERLKAVFADSNAQPAAQILLVHLLNHDVPFLERTLRDRALSVHVRFTALGFLGGKHRLAEKILQEAGLKNSLMQDFESRALPEENFRNAAAAAGISPAMLIQTTGIFEALTVAEILGAQAVDAGTLDTVVGRAVERGGILFASDYETGVDIFNANADFRAGYDLLDQLNERQTSIVLAHEAAHVFSTEEIPGIAGEDRGQDYDTFVTGLDEAISNLAELARWQQIKGALTQEDVNAVADLTLQDGHEEVGLSDLEGHRVSRLTLLDFTGRHPPSNVDFTGLFRAVFSGLKTNPPDLKDRAAAATAVTRAGEIADLLESHLPERSELRSDERAKRDKVLDIARRLNDRFNLTAHRRSLNADFRELTVEPEDTDAVVKASVAMSSLVSNLDALDEDLIRAALEEVNRILLAKDNYLLLPERLGAGSPLTVVSPQAMREMEKAKADLGVPADYKIGKLLIIEDYPSFAENYTAWASQLNIPAQIVRTREEAEAALRSGEYNFVITDINLTFDSDRRDGVELINAYRAAGSTETPVLFVSALERTDIENEVGNWKRTAFMRKVSVLEENGFPLLTEIIREALPGRSELRAEDRMFQSMFARTFLQRRADRTGSRIFIERIEKSIQDAADESALASLIALMDQIPTDKTAEGEVARLRAAYFSAFAKARENKIRNLIEFIASISGSKLPEDTAVRAPKLEIIRMILDEDLENPAALEKRLSTEGISQEGTRLVLDRLKTESSSFKALLAESRFQWVKQIGNSFVGVGIGQRYHTTFKGDQKALFDARANFNSFQEMRQAVAERFAEASRPDAITWEFITLARALADDLYGVEIVVPFAGETLTDGDRKTVSGFPVQAEDAASNPALLGLIGRTVTMILEAFARFEESKELVSANIGFKRIYIVPEGRAHFSPGRDYIFINALSLRENREVFYHEMGHGVLVEDRYEKNENDRRVPFFVSETALRDFQSRYGYSPYEDQSGLAGRSRAAYRILREIFEKRRAQWDGIQQAARRKVITQTGQAAYDALTPEEKERRHSLARAAILNEINFSVNLEHDYMFMIPFQDQFMRTFLRTTPATPEDLERFNFRGDFDEFLAENFKLFYIDPAALQAFDPEMSDYLSLLTGSVPEAVSPQEQAQAPVYVPVISAGLQKIAEVLDTDELQSLLEARQNGAGIPPAILDKLSGVSPEIADEARTASTGQLFEIVMILNQENRLTTENILQEIDRQNEDRRVYHEKSLKRFEDAQAGHPGVQRDAAVRLAALAENAGAEALARAAENLLERRRTHALLFFDSSSEAEALERRVLGVLKETLRSSYFRPAEEWRLFDRSLKNFLDAAARSELRASSPEGSLGEEVESRNFRIVDEYTSSAPQRGKSPLDAGRMTYFVRDMYGNPAKEVTEVPTVKAGGVTLYHLNEGAHLILKRMLATEGLATDVLLSCVLMALEITMKDGSAVHALGHHKELRTAFENTLGNHTRDFTENLRRLGTDIAGVKAVMYYGRSNSERGENNEAFSRRLAEAKALLAQTISGLSPEAAYTVKEISDEGLGRGAVAATLTQDGLALKMHYRLEDNAGLRRTVFVPWSEAGQSVQDGDRSELRTSSPEGSLGKETIGSNAELRTSSPEGSLGKETIGPDAGLSSSERFSAEMILRTELPRVFETGTIAYADFGAGTGQFMENFNPFLRSLGASRIQNVGIEYDEPSALGVPLMLEKALQAVKDAKTGEERARAEAAVQKARDASPVVFGDATDYEGLEKEYGGLLSKGSLDLIVINAPNLLLPGFDFGAWLDSAKYFLKPDGLVMIRLHSYQGRPEAEVSEKRREELEKLKEALESRKENFEIQIIPEGAWPTDMPRGKYELLNTAVLLKNKGSKFKGGYAGKEAAAARSDDRFELRSKTVEFGPHETVVFRNRQAGLGRLFEFGTETEANFVLVTARAGMLEFPVYIPAEAYKEAEAEIVIRNLVGLYQDAFARFAQLGGRVPEGTVFKTYFGRTNRAGGRPHVYDGSLYASSVDFGIPGENTAQILKHEMGHLLSRLEKAGIIDDSRSIAIEEGIANYVGGSWDLSTAENRGRRTSSYKYRAPSGALDSLKGFLQLDVEQELGGDLAPLENAKKYLGFSHHRYGDEFLDAFQEVFGTENLWPFLKLLGGGLEATRDDYNSKRARKEKQDYGSALVPGILKDLGYNNARIETFRRTLYRNLRDSLFTGRGDAPLGAEDAVPELVEGVSVPGEEPVEGVALTPLETALLELIEESGWTPAAFRENLDAAIHYLENAGLAASGYQENLTETFDQLYRDFSGGRSELRSGEDAEAELPEAMRVYFHQWLEDLEAIDPLLEEKIAYDNSPEAKALLISRLSEAGEFSKEEIVRNLKALKDLLLVEYSLRVLDRTTLFGKPEETETGETKKKKTPEDLVIGQRLLDQRLLTSPSMEKRIQKLLAQPENRASFLIARNLAYSLESARGSYRLPWGEFSMGKNGRLLWFAYRKNSLNEEALERLEMPRVFEAVTQGEGRGFYEVSVEPVSAPPKIKGEVKDLKKGLEMLSNFGKSVLAGYQVTERQPLENPEVIQTIFDLMWREMEVLDGVEIPSPAEEGATAVDKALTFDPERNFNLPGYEAMLSFYEKLQTIYDADTGLRLPEPPAEGDDAQRSELRADGEREDMAFLEQVPLEINELIHESRRLEEEISASDRSIDEKEEQLKLDEALLNSIPRVRFVRKGQVQAKINVLKSAIEKDKAELEEKRTQRKLVEQRTTDAASDALKAIDAAVQTLGARVREDAVLFQGTEDGYAKVLEILLAERRQSLLRKFTANLEAQPYVFNPQYFLSDVRRNIGLREKSKPEFENSLESYWEAAKENPAFLQAFGKEAFTSLEKSLARESLEELARLDGYSNASTALGRRLFWLGKINEDVRLEWAPYIAGNAWREQGGGSVPTLRPTQAGQETEYYPVHDFLLSLVPYLGTGRLMPQLETIVTLVKENAGDWWLPTAPTAEYSLYMDFQKDLLRELKWDETSYDSQRSLEYLLRNYRNNEASPRSAALIEKIAAQKGIDPLKEYPPAYEPRQLKQTIEQTVRELFLKLMSAAEDETLKLFAASAVVKRARYESAAFTPEVYAAFRSAIAETRASGELVRIIDILLKRLDEEDDAEALRVLLDHKAHIAQHLHPLDRAAVATQSIRSMAEREPSVEEPEFSAALLGSSAEEIGQVVRDIRDFKSLYPDFEYYVVTRKSREGDFSGFVFDADDVLIELVQLSRIVARLVKLYATAGEEEQKTKLQAIVRKHLLKKIPGLETGLEMGGAVLTIDGLMEMLLKERRFQIPFYVENFINAIDIYSQQRQTGYFNGEGYEEAGASQAARFSYEATRDLGLEKFMALEGLSGNFAVHQTKTQDLMKGIIQAGQIIPRQIFEALNEANLFETMLKEGNVTALGSSDYVHFAINEPIHYLAAPFAVVYPVEVLLENQSYAQDPLSTGDWYVGGFSPNPEHESHRIPVKNGVILAPESAKKELQAFMDQLEENSNGEWRRPQKIFYYEGESVHEGYPQFVEAFKLQRQEKIKVSRAPKPHRRVIGGRRDASFVFSIQEPETVDTRTQYQSLPFLKRLEDVQKFSGNLEALAGSVLSGMEAATVVNISDTGSSKRGTYQERYEHFPDDFDLMVKLSGALPEEENLVQFAHEFSRSLQEQEWMKAVFNGSEDYVVEPEPNPVRSLPGGGFLAKLRVFRGQDRSVPVLSIDTVFFNNEELSDGLRYQEAVVGSGGQLDRITQDLPEEERREGKLYVLSTIRTLKALFKNNGVYTRSQGGFRGVGTEQLVLQLNGTVPAEDGNNYGTPRPAQSLGDLKRIFSVENALKKIEDAMFKDGEYAGIKIFQEQLALWDPGAVPGNPVNLSEGILATSLVKLIELTTQGAQALQELEQSAQSAGRSELRTDSDESALQKAEEMSGKSLDLEAIAKKGGFRDARQLRSAVNLINSPPAGDDERDNEWVTKMLDSVSIGKEKAGLSAQETQIMRGVIPMQVIEIVYRDSNFKAVAMARLTENMLGEWHLHTIAASRDRSLLTGRAVYAVALEALKHVADFNPGSMALSPDGAAFIVSALGRLLGKLTPEEKEFIGLKEQIRAELRKAENDEELPGILEKVEDVSGQVLGAIEEEVPPEEAASSLYQSIEIAPEFFDLFVAALYEKAGEKSTAYIGEMLAAMKHMTARISKLYPDARVPFVLSPTGDRAPLDRADAAAYTDALGEAAPLIGRVFYQGFIEKSMKEALEKADVVSFQPVNSLSQIRDPGDLKLTPVLKLDGKRREIPQKFLVQFGILREGAGEDAAVRPYEQAFAIFMQFALGFVAAQELSKPGNKLELDLLLDLNAFSGERGEELSPEATLREYALARGKTEAQVKKEVERLKAALIGPLGEMLAQRGGGAILQGLELGSPNISMKNIQTFLEAYREVMKSA